MARIYPERLPEHVLVDPRRTAERAVFEALSQLPDPFVVYYSVAWLSRRPAGDAQDGEADFVIAHPELGVLVLEVKGGAISYDGIIGEWTSVNRNGEVFHIKDPAAQARTSKHALLQKLQDMPGWSKDWLTIGHAVAFPDTVVANIQLRPDLPKEIVLDATSLATLEQALRRIFAYFQQADGRAGRPGADRLQVMSDLLAKSFSLRTPLGVELAYQDERLIELTEQQMQVLDMLSFQRRATVCGCAGSGKTILALEKARRLAAEGFDVLLTCFNIQLAEHLTHRAPDGVNVFHFHGLCEHLIKEAGVRAIPPRDPGSYYNQFLPDMLLEAIENLGPQYDAIVVDEGQDFRENWWLALNELLRDPKTGVLYVFFDDNQNLYQGVTQLAGLIDSQPFLLVENCRNTQQIHRLVASFHQQGSRLKARGPLGTAPQWLPYTTTDEMLRILRKTLHTLVNEEAIAPQDLVVLTPRAEARSALAEGLTLGNFSLTRKSQHPPGQIQVSTIHRFKGLERKVVIIAELDEAAHRDKNLILYIGCSRARVHLILLHDHGFSM
ncbi:MAG: nuclease [Chloroflexota bacterium]|nr:MAG: nuclease [Chloroflexota bacterium]